MLDSLSTTRRARRGLLREWRLHALSIFSLTVAFVCLGTALLALTNLHALEERWAHAGRASIYLRDNARQDEIDALRTAISKVPSVTAVRYLSSGQARAELTAADPAAAASLAGAPGDLFPASIEVEMQETASQGEVDAMVAKLRQIPVVEDVETYQTWTERLARLVRGGVAASALLALVVLSAVLAVVGSTIRLALQRRRAEVEVLKLVGATDAFVKGPFVLEGTLQGGFGALGAIGVLGGLFALVRARLDQELVGLIGLEPLFLPWPVMAGLVALGAGLGALAAVVSLRRLVTV